MATAAAALGKMRLFMGEMIRATDLFIRVS